MYKFFTRVIIISVSTYIVGYLLHFVIDKGLKSTAEFSGSTIDWENIYNSGINADWIIQGSSRAMVQINPAVVDSALKVNSYNLGLDGYNFHMQYWRYRIYAEHNKNPDLIIQSVDIFSLSKRPDLYAYEQFIPYLDDPSIKQATKDYKGFNIADYYFPLYKYTHRPNMAINALKAVATGSTQKQVKYKGFYSVEKKWTSEFSVFEKQNPDGYHIVFDTATIQLFDHFLNDCKTKKIKVVMVYTPEYIEGQKFTVNRDTMFNIYKSFATKYNIPFLDYSSSPICTDTMNFYNSQHLNKSGVEKFNKIFVEDLKKIYP